jgi:Tol biopolymer transport system component
VRSIAADSPSRLLYRLPQPRLWGCGAGESEKGPDEIFNVEWSPDGRWIGSGDGVIGCYVSQLRLVSADGTRQRVLDGAHDSNITSGLELDATDTAWSHDSKRLVFSARGIRIARSDGTQARPLKKANDDLVEAEHPTWSPDGSQILFTYDDDIYTVPSEGGNPLRIGPLATDTQEVTNTTPSWMP